MEKILDLHELKIEKNILTLDGFEIKGLISYKVEKNSADEPTELFIKVAVQDL